MALVIGCLCGRLMACPSASLHTDHSCCCQRDGPNDGPFNYDDTDAADRDAVSLDDDEFG